MKWVLVLLLVLCVGCSKGSDSEDEDAIEVDSRYTDLVKGFGDSLAQKDYRSAYDRLSTNMRGELSYDEFVETLTPYLDSFSGSIEAGYSDPADPEGMEAFVPEADRSKLVAEYTVELSGTIEEDDDATYFCTVWAIDEAGTPRVGSFYIED